MRIWADSRFIEQAAGDCIESLASKGLALVEKSEVYPCRPPKQLESRIYLAFQKEPEKEAVPKSDDAVLSKK